MRRGTENVKAALNRSEDAAGSRRARRASRQGFLRVRRTGAQSQHERLADVNHVSGLGVAFGTPRSTLTSEECTPAHERSRKRISEGNLAEAFTSVLAVARLRIHDRRKRRRTVDVLTLGTTCQNDLGLSTSVHVGHQRRGHKHTSCIVVQA